jgi:hypothetical protein
MMVRAASGFPEGSGRDVDMPTLLPILLSWAVTLSGYDAPAVMPEVRYEPHDFFVQHVCGGKECNAVGWYNDQDIVYIDQKYAQGEDSFATSLVVHELTHYLQHHSGHFDSQSCPDSLTREREAYRVQNDYLLMAQSSIDLIRPAPTACNYSAVAAVNPDTAHANAETHASE